MIRGLDTYTYDKRNRLVEAQTGGGAVQSIYDYRGQRVAKVANGVVTRYFGDGFEREDDSVNRKYIFTGGEKGTGTFSRSLAVTTD